MLQLVKWCALSTQNVFEVEHNGDMYSRKTWLWYFWGGTIYTLKYKVELPSVTWDDTNICFHWQNKCHFALTDDRRFEKALENQNYCLFGAKGAWPSRERNYLQAGKNNTALLHSRSVLSSIKNNINLILLWYRSTNVRSRFVFLKACVLGAGGAELHWAAVFTMWWAIHSLTT